jgi:lipopolysaccharide export system protein LptA
VRAGYLAALFVLALPLTAAAQELDLSHGGPIDITATDGIDWRQEQQMVVAHGNARATRGDVTVMADSLTAWYRPKGGANPTATPAKAPATTGPGNGPGDDVGGNEIYKMEALGHVRILSKTDQVVGDKAVYDIDQAVLVMTGTNMKLTTATQILTARDTLEYWAQKHMAVARGDAVALTNDARRIAADTLVAYTTPSDQTAPAAPPKPNPAGGPAAPAAADPLGASGKLQKMEAFGHVSLRTQTDTVTGDRGVYIPETGLARLAGHIHITRGQNQLNGAEAIVNMKTGVARLVSNAGGRVQGLVLPNDQTNGAIPGLAPTPAPAGRKP